MEPRYLRMINGMRKGKRRDWSVYVLCCEDGSFYTGIAKDVEARINKHRKGTGAAYTRTRLPVRLLYQEDGLTHSQALIREAKVKALPRPKKEKLILYNKNHAE